MKASLLLLLSLLLLPTASRAQLDFHDCLQEECVDNRASGKVFYASDKHPFNGIPFEGYYIVLLRPRCFDFAPVADPHAKAEITQLQLMTYANNQLYKMQDRFFTSDDIDERWRQLDRYLRPRIGQYVVVTGQLEMNNTAYYVAYPQIVVRSIAPCEITPKSKAVEKC